MGTKILGLGILATSLLFALFRAVFILYQNHSSIRSVVDAALLWGLGVMFLSPFIFAIGAITFELFVPVKMQARLYYEADAKEEKRGRQYRQKMHAIWGTTSPEVFPKRGLYQVERGVSCYSSEIPEREVTVGIQKGDV